MPAPTPTLITRPFADTAGGAFITFPVPDVTADPARADFQSGFKPDSMTPKVAGGTPPFGQDFNGVLKQITQNQVFTTAGQMYPFSAAVSTALGGYALGAVVAMTDGTGTWISLVAANTDDPEAGGGSAQWAPMYRYDITPKTGLTGGVVALTFLESRSRMIVLTGALVSNLQIVLPNLLQEWLIVNATTGLFDTTVRTAAGVGVLIPQGGYPNAVQVYGNTVDIFYSANPISIAASVTPTNNSLAQRDNTGALFGTRFDDLTGLVNTLGPRSVAAAAGYYTWPQMQMKRGIESLFGGQILTVTYTGPAFTTWAIPIASPVIPDGADSADNVSVIALNGTNGITGFNIKNWNNRIVTVPWIALGI
jgi:hypothetical protein